MNGKKVESYRVPPSMGYLWRVMKAIGLDLYRGVPEFMHGFWVGSGTDSIHVTREMIQTLSDLHEMRSAKEAEGRKPEDKKR